jgi:hypothetical protein
MRFVEHRIGDRRINRLIRKWLKAGVMEDGGLVTTGGGIVNFPRPESMWRLSGQKNHISLVLV